MKLCKVIEADYYGRVTTTRWFFSGKRDAHGLSWVDKVLPGGFLSLYAGQSQPSEFAHSHPWSSLAIILRGHYIEVVNGVERRVSRWFSLLSYKDNHRFEYVKPGTISLFLHWRRKQAAQFTPVKCETICEPCAAGNAGVCVKGASEMSLDEKAALDPDWRVSRWFVVDARSEAALARRRRALGKMGIFAAADEQQKDLVTKAFIERRV